VISSSADRVDHKLFFKQAKLLTQKSSTYHYIR